MKSKEQKQADAVQRRAAHDGLTTVGKLAKLMERPGESTRERARLLDGAAA